MFDPLYAGVVLRSDIKHWEVAEKTGLREHGKQKKRGNNQHQKKVQIYVVMILQKKLHAALLEPHTNDEEMMIDRLKFLCGIQPRYMSKIDVCLSVVDGVEVAVNYPFAYSMIYVPFVMEKGVSIQVLSGVVTGRNDLPRLEFMPDVGWEEWAREPLSRGEKMGKEEEELEPSMELEICKILIFWYIAGVSRPSEEMLFVRNMGHKCPAFSRQNSSDRQTEEKKTVISGWETLAGSKRFSLQLIEKYMDDDDTVKMAQKLVTQNIDMDHVRGIVCGTREMTRDVRNRSNLKLSVDYKLYLERFELRCEFVMNCGPQELRDRMLVLDGELVLG